MSKKILAVVLCVCATLILAVSLVYANYVHLQSVSVTTPPSTTVYVAGENFDATGMVVTITHTDGTTAVVNDYTILDGTKLQSGQTAVTISYTKDGVTKTTTQPISIYQSFTVTADNRKKIGYTGSTSKNLVIPSTFEDTDGTWYKVARIGVIAFSGCTGLTSVAIPDSVTSIGGSAFYGCSNLTSVTIPDSVASIDDGVFSDCVSLASVTIPDSVTSIGCYAFSGCTGLTSLTIPDSVTFIGESAFYGCTGLTSLTLGNNVNFIGNSAFNGCTGLTGDLVIPDGTTLINFDSFSGCTGLTSITIPDSVTFIGSYAFSGCTGLTSVAIPDSVKTIGDAAFYNCTGLTDVYYSGTEEQWNAITIGSNNTPLTSAKS